MNSYHRLFAVGIAAILVLALVNTYYINNSSNSVKLEIVLGMDPHENSGPDRAYFYVSASYHIKVYRNGELIAERVKEDDPITAQWYSLVANYLLGLRYTDVVQSYYTVDNVVGKSFDTEADGGAPVMYIEVGSGTLPVSRNDYSLGVFEARFQPVVSFSDDNVNYVYTVTYTATWTVDHDFVLREVGLSLYFDTAELALGSSIVQNDGRATNVYKKYLLVAHDVVSPEISLVAGDSLSITYQISIPYSINGPFTRNFYAVLLRYFLGAGPVLDIIDEDNSVVACDFGDDYHYWGGYYNDDGYLVNSVDDKVRVGVGNSSTASFMYTSFSIGSLVARSVPDMIIVNTTSGFTVKYIKSFTFVEPRSISEVGLYLFTDTNGGDAVSKDDILLIYWVLPSPINVAENSGLRVEITIIIPYT